MPSATLSDEAASGTALPPWALLPSPDCSTPGGLHARAAEDESGLLPRLDAALAQLPHSWQHSYTAVNVTSPKGRRRIRKLADTTDELT